MLNIEPWRVLTWCCLVCAVVVSQGSEANFVPVNPADYILHLCMSLAMVYSHHLEPPCATAPRRRL